jgi:hypothetical protein
MLMVFLQDPEVLPLWIAAYATPLSIYEAVEPDDPTASRKNLL